LFAPYPLDLSTNIAIVDLTVSLVEFKKGDNMQKFTFIGWLCGVGLAEI
jgi:hypothetical protein